MSEFIERASKVASKLLVGAQLDSIQVHSVLLVLSFNRLGMGLPYQVWLTCSADMSFMDGDSGHDRSPRHVSFADRRATLIAKAYTLIGAKVTDVQVKSEGDLLLQFEGTNLTVTPAGDDLEESWGISETSAQSPDRQWYVGWDDEGHITVKEPKQEDS